MMLKQVSPEVACQLLRHIAEHKALARMVEELGEGVTWSEAKRILFEIAGLVSALASREPTTESAPELKDWPELSEKAKMVLSCLSPREEKKLLSKFGFLEP